MSLENDSLKEFGQDVGAWIGIFIMLCLMPLFIFIGILFSIYDRCNHLMENKRKKKLKSRRKRK